MNPARYLPILGNCGLLLFLACSGCAAGAANDAIPPSTDATHCFVLPGAGTGVTKSYRVLVDGGLEEAGGVSGGAMHMRAAFHPDGRTLYVSSVGPAGVEPPDRAPWTGAATWEEGVHVRAYAYDPADCSIGGLLGTGRMGPEAPEINRAYGLEVHPNGRYLYQTTNSLRRIRLFDLPEDRVPVPRAEFDVTADGEHVCIQVRRLAVHPSRRYLYANCNNGGGVEDALQLWAIDREGSLALVQHYTFPAMYGGVLDPVVHPSGNWLYQPVGTGSPKPPSGAYVLVFRVGDDGRLRLHDQVAVRTTGDEPVADTSYVSFLPMNVLLHPDGGTAYVPVSANIPERAVFPHGFAIYAVEEGGARLVERAWLPAPRDTRFSDHHGATLSRSGGELFLYSYLTDYDRARGGVLQRLHIEGDHSLEPLDPPWVPTGLFDGRQPIAMPGNASAARAGDWQDR